MCVNYVCVNYVVVMVNKVMEFVSEGSRLLVLSSGCVCPCVSVCQGVCVLVCVCVSQIQAGIVMMSQPVS